MCTSFLIILPFIKLIVNVPSKIDESIPNKAANVNVKAKKYGRGVLKHCNGLTVQQCNSLTVQQCNGITVQHCNGLTVQRSSYSHFDGSSGTCLEINRCTTADFDYSILYCNLPIVGCSQLVDL